MPTIQPTLSILIPSLRGRSDMLTALFDRIQAQIDAGEYQKQVEVLSFLDNRTRSVGLKRQALLDAARGKYVVFCDDDDDVLEGYVAEILGAAAQDPDVITFNQISYIGDAPPVTIRFALEHENEEVHIPGPSEFKRKPWHVCAWRAEIAKRCVFPDASYGEDWWWSAQANALARTQVRINKPLHVYRFEPSVTQAERTFPPPNIPVALPEILDDENDHPPEMDFSAEYAECLAQCAQVISDIVEPRKNLHPYTTILDVGSNIGQWCRAFERTGATDITAVDSFYMRDHLLSPHYKFVAADLRHPLWLGRKYGLVLCLETAEHLSERHARNLVGSLCRHGDTICFSAAEPGQGGHKHRNEQPPAYWYALFGKFGYEAHPIGDKLPPCAPAYYRSTMTIFRRIPC